MQKKSDKGYSETAFAVVIIVKTATVPTQVHQTIPALHFSIPTRWFSRQRRPHFLGVLMKDIVDEAVHYSVSGSNRSR